MLFHISQILNVDFIFFIHTNKTSASTSLYLYQGVKAKLIAYAGKRMPEVTKNYSITELELYGLAIHIVYSHLLKKQDIDAVVNDFTSIYIDRSKTEPPTASIQTLLENLNTSSFYLYYMKNKDIVLGDFLSINPKEAGVQHEIILISFSLLKILKEKYCNIKMSEMLCNINIIGKHNDRTI